MGGGGCGRERGRGGNIERDRERADRLEVRHRKRLRVGG